MNPKATTRIITFIAIIPFLIAGWVWFSPLAFVPVPWPDDSAFYFVAKELFRWPPRWVMLPQAPFEPTYRIFNFNTMPLFPILIGLGRWVGIDGIFAIKFWSLLGWALSGSLLGVTLLRAKLPKSLALVFLLGFCLDPILRWGSVLVRPESLVGLCGLAIVLGITLGFPRRIRPLGVWDPISALLAVGAYTHFNAVHLLFPVIIAFINRPKRLVSIGLKTTLYLLPWAITVALHPSLFVQQMSTQWKRLAVSNDWLSTSQKALESLFQSMGSPESWPKILFFASIALWFFIFAALVLGLFLPGLNVLYKKIKKTPEEKGLKTHTSLRLTSAAGWVLGTLWLWNNKPEVWFTYFIHASIWTFTALAALKAWQTLRSPSSITRTISVLSLSINSVIAILLVAIFAYVDFTQATRLGKDSSWKWETYNDLINCVDQQLTQLESQLGNPRPFRVWDPTFPDITIELSRRHPNWELTRTNDFYERRDLAIQHGHDVEAVVVPETLGYTSRNISAPASEHPEIVSQWMTWDQYFLRQLWDTPQWKTNRYLCQRGRWQAFLFMKSKPN